MAEDQIEPREQIVRSSGTTDSERYLSWLCGRTFLSLWTYPGLYRDQRARGASTDGKEPADLVVVFENDVILFSDKHCDFPLTGDVGTPGPGGFDEPFESQSGSFGGRSDGFACAPTDSSYKRCHGR